MAAAAASKRSSAAVIFYNGCQAGKRARARARTQAVAAPAAARGRLEAKGARACFLHFSIRSCWLKAITHWILGPLYEEYSPAFPHSFIN